MTGKQIIKCEFGNRVQKENKTYLARKIVEMYPNKFKNLESARKIISQLVNPKQDRDVVLAFSCFHAPANHPDAIGFLKYLKHKYNPNKIINLGDTADVATPSRFGSNPDHHSASDELAIAQEELAELADIFPKMKVCESNHTYRYFIQAKQAGLPREALRSINDILNVPYSWNFAPEHIHNGVIYRHGHGATTAFSNACNTGSSHVQGHLHSKFEVRYTRNPFHTIFGCNVGSLVNPDAETMKYGKYAKHKPVLGAAIIYNGTDVELKRLS